MSSFSPPGERTAYIRTEADIIEGGCRGKLLTAAATVFPFLKFNKGGKENNLHLLEKEGRQRMRKVDKLEFPSSSFFLLLFSLRRNFPWGSRLWKQGTLCSCSGEKSQCCAVLSSFPLPSLSTLRWSCQICFHLERPPPDPLLTICARGSIGVACRGALKVDLSHTWREGGKRKGWL